jgi:large subunit ribosomal protein L5
MARLQEKFDTELRGEIQQKLGLGNLMQVPHITKITLNMIGCKVTLRRERMYEFLDRLVNIAIPRTRDFRGLSPKSFDRQGNYSLGVQEQIVFPEIDYDHIDAIRGMDITITTTARGPEEGRALLEAFNFPFKR